MVILKLPDEIEKARASNRIVAEVLSKLREKVKPGVTTKALDKFAEEITEKEVRNRHLRATEGFPIPCVRRLTNKLFMECHRRGFWLKAIL